MFTADEVTAKMGSFWNGTRDALSNAASAAGSAVSDFVDSANQAVNPYYGRGGGSSGNTTGIWKYPLTLEDTHHTSRLVFSATNAIIGDEPDGGKSKAFGNWKQLKYKNIGSVFMYMPKIQQSYTQNFSEEGRGLLWQVLNAIEAGGGMSELIGDAGANAIKTIGGEVINRTAPGLVRDFAQQIKNQHLSAHYTGTALRTQKFDFELRPRNIQELVQIAGLFKFFKANSATSFDSGDTLRVPSRWVIEEMPMNGGGRIIPPYRFGPAYLTGIEIDHTPDGSWKTFENGDPISFRLSLEFIELTIVTREDIEALDL